MAFKFVPPTYAEGTEILHDKKILEALHAKAEQLYGVAKGYAEQAGMDEAVKEMSVVDGVRPKGRPFSQVLIDHEDGERMEFGDTSTAKRRILGRAGNVSL